MVLFGKKEGKEDEIPGRIDGVVIKDDEEGGLFLDEVGGAANILVVDGCWASRALFFLK